MTTGGMPHEGTTALERELREMPVLTDEEVAERDRQLRQLAEKSAGIFDALGKADRSALELPGVRAGMVLEAKLRTADMTTVRVPREALELFVQHAGLLYAAHLRTRWIIQQRKLAEAAQRAAILREKAARSLDDQPKEREWMVVRDGNGVQVAKVDVTGLNDRQRSIALRDALARREAARQRPRGRA